MKLNELMEKYGDYEVKDGFMDLLKKPKTKTVYDLKYGDRYFFLTASGFVQGGTWSNDSSDFNRQRIGNTFLTEEDAKFAKERLKVIAELKKYAKEFSDEEWTCGSVQKYYFYYDWSMDKLEISYHYKIFYGDQLLFESQEKLQEAIDAVGEERIKKYYFGVKE